MLRRARTLLLFRSLIFLVRCKGFLFSRLGFLRGKQSFFSCVGVDDETSDSNIMLDKSAHMINQDARRVMGRAILGAISSGRV